MIVDSYLPCCAIESCKIPLDMMQMLYADTPQFENLPDLGGEIRSAMVESTEQTTKKTFLQRIFAGVLGGMRKNQQAAQYTKLNTSNIDLTSVSILLNLLLASLLGLYPLTHRFTQWNARIHIYKRIHFLLTSPPAEQIHFIQKHALMLVPCITEYICNIVYAYMPTEKDVLFDWVGGERNFMKMTQAMDTFRWYHIETGNENWQAWSDAIQSSMDLSRNKRQWISKKTSRHLLHRKEAPTVQDILLCLDVPHLTLFPAHQTNPIQIHTDYQKLIAVPIPELRLNMEISILPKEIVDVQLKQLRSLSPKCELLCNSMRTRHVCLFCVVYNQSCVLRFCQTSGTWICAQHPKIDLVNVDMVGKVLRLGNIQYILTPGDTGITCYTGNSHKVWKSGSRSLSELPVKFSKQCRLCGAVNGLGIVYDILNTEKLEICDIVLCHWHRPPDDLLKYCANLKQVYQAAIQWENQNKMKCRPRRYSTRLLV